MAKIPDSWIWIAALFATLAAERACLGQVPPGGETVQHKKPAVVVETDKGPQDGDYDGWITELVGKHYGIADLDAALVSANGLGVDLAAPAAALRAQLGLDEGAGLIVTAAPPESTGAKAGLAVHDVIVELGDQKVGDAAKLKDTLVAAAGKSVKLGVLRAGKSLAIDVPLPKLEVAQIDWTPKRWRLTLNESSGVEERYRLGVSLSEADETLRSQLRLAAGEGLVVTDVIEGSAAAAAGVQTNDVLIVLDGRRLTTVNAINDQVQEIKDRQVEMRLLRSGKELSLQLAPRKTKEAAFSNQAVRLWDMKSCQRCHREPFDDAQAAHLLLSDKLGAHHSAWTDGSKLYLYEKFFAGKPEAAGGPQQQIAALKSQLAEMHKTLAALEASLASKTDQDKENPKAEQEKK
jgi:membrane-associated protease RseP (regulator of RpoE activity)